MAQGLETRIAAGHALLERVLAAERPFYDGKGAA